MLKLQNLKSQLIENTLMLRRIEGSKRRGNRGYCGWTASPTQWTGLSKFWDVVKDRKPRVLQSLELKRVGHDLATENNNHNNMC